MKNAHAAIESYRRAIGASALICGSSPQTTRRSGSPRPKGLVWTRPGIRSTLHVSVLASLLSKGRDFKVGRTLSILYLLKQDTDLVTHVYGKNFRLVI
jgi:hypothetical protein